MIFYVIELQTTETGAAIVSVFNDQATAEQAYHTVLAAAAVSEVKKHGAMLVNEDLFVIKKEIYSHIEPEPQPEPNEA